MYRIILLTLILATGIFSCKPSVYKQFEGEHAARIFSNVAVDPSADAMMNAATVRFTFNKDKTMTYYTKVMGKEMNVTGTYEIIGDSIHMRNLDPIPDGHFKYTKLPDGEGIKLEGSGNFILSKVSGE